MIDIDKWECLASEAVDIPDPAAAASIFQQLIDIWTSSYQVVNKRLAGVENIPIEAEEAIAAAAHANATHPSQPYRVVKLVPKRGDHSNRFYDIIYEAIQVAVIYPVNLMNGANQPQLHPHPHPHIDHAYALRLQCQPDGGVSLQLLIKPTPIDINTDWLKEIAFPKMLKWLRRIGNQDTDMSACNSLINASAYHNRYTHIKETWAREIAKNWTEKTNPAKYIFEDVGIASYLLEYLNKQPIIKVADIGCGNGLLAYFLKREGVDVIGIDVRRRRIWDQQLAGVVDLRELALDPSSSSSLNVLQEEGITYLIGNHSDELTPWIPVMAARMGIGFFLLPCCPFDFYGKFNKCGGKCKGGLSEQYYSYVQSIIERLGFELRVDKLKIPSLKRKCFIGVVPEGGLPSNVDSIIDELLVKPAATTTKGFIPRPAQIEMRNCTSISLEFRQALVKKIFNYLLNLSSENSTSGWRCGGSASLISISDQLSTEEKAMLRHQHGGLQTLIKNHHQIFLIQKGQVEIRKWPLLYKVTKSKMRSPSKSQCWFYANHPNGCPVIDCPYLHV